MSNQQAVMAAVYDNEGCILRIVSCASSQLEGQASEGEQLIEVGETVSDDTHYIHDGEAVEKSVLSPSVTIDGFTATITDLPAGLEVEFDGVTAITDDDPLEIELDEPGTYKLRIDGGAPYIGMEVGITFG